MPKAIYLVAHDFTKTPLKKFKNTFKLLVPLCLSNMLLVFVCYSVFPLASISGTPCATLVPYLGPVSAEQTFEIKEPIEATIGNHRCGLENAIGRNPHWQIAASEKKTPNKACRAPLIRQDGVARSSTRPRLANHHRSELELKGQNAQ